MRRRLNKSGVKSYGSTVKLRSKLFDSSLEEEGGIPGVGVKSIDIRKNTGGEGGLLV